MRHLFKAVFAALFGGLLLAVSQPFSNPSIPSHNVDLPYQGLLALFAFIPLLLSFDAFKLRTQFLFGYCLFFVGNVLTLFWIFVSLHTIGGVSLSKSIGFWFLAAFLLSIPCGLAFPITSWFERRHNFPRWLAFPIALCTMEWIKGHFPWEGFTLGNLGHSLVSAPILAQSASVVGMYGLVFIGALISASIADLIRFKHAPSAWPALAALVATLLVTSFYGLNALHKNISFSNKSISIGILQGDIPVDEKRKQLEHEAYVFDIYKDLHRQASKQGVDLIVWPESAFPFLVDRFAKRITQFDQFERSTIIGAITNGERIEPRASYTYDTAFVVRANSEVVDAYDKVHLIPIAEYLPWIAKFILYGPIVYFNHIYPGKEIRPLNVPLENGDSFKVGTFICYDGIYPAVTRELTAKGAEFLLQLSSEAWYIASNAPNQFLNMYRLRAIETGRTLVRAANNGVSGWIDPHGFVHDASKMSERKLVTARVPVATGMTPYVIYGDVVALSCCALVAALLLWELMRLARRRFTKPVAVPA